jgi:hypothetical protein
MPGGRPRLHTWIAADWDSQLTGSEHQQHNAKRSFQARVRNLVAYYHEGVQCSDGKRRVVPWVLESQLYRLCQETAGLAGLVLTEIPAALQQDLGGPPSLATGVLVRL